MYMRAIGFIKQLKIIWYDTSNANYYDPSCYEIYHLSSFLMKIFMNNFLQVRAK
jgi:hypothetical protein